MATSLLRQRRSTNNTRRRSTRGQSHRLGLERLEERCLLAPVTWDGGGGNSDWNNAANWDTNTVPVAEDTAVIDLDGTFTVSLSSNVTIAGLTLGGASGTQTLNVGFRTLTINGPATITPHGFLVTRASPTLNGTINGTGTLTNQGTVESRQGGTINLPFDNATSDSVFRFGHDSSTDGAAVRFGQGFTNHGLVESTSFQGQGQTMDFIIASGAGTLVNAPEGRIHVVPGPKGGPRRFLLTLDNQGTLKLDHPMELVSGTGSAHTNSGSIILQAGSFTAKGVSGSSFSNTGEIDIGAGQTFQVSGAGAFFSPQGFNQQGGMIRGPGTLRLTQLAANFTTDFSNAETSLQFNTATINGPGTLHMVRDATWTASIFNAPIVNDSILNLIGGVKFNGPFTANPGSTLRVSGNGSDFGQLTLPNGFTNHGVIELTNLTTGGPPAQLTINSGTLVNAPDGIIRASSGNLGGLRAIRAAIDNQGLIEVLEEDLSIHSALTTSGTVRIGEGRSLTIFANLDIAQTGLVAAAGPASLTMANLTGAAQNPGNLSNLAVKTAAFENLIEAMSEDRGATPTGFDSNFALRQLTTNGSVQIVDDSDNSPGDAPEAVYVQTLVVQNFSPLDLNGLHVYARAVTIGTVNTGISNGTIQIVNDGGPISLNQFEPGNLANASERDEWEFFGRAGQTVTVVAKTGGTDPDDPVAPQIGFAQVELTDAADTLLGTASNATQGEDAVLLNIELPADGVYSIFVSASPDHASAFGNYQIGVFDATADEARIVFNQPYLGHIENSFAVDRWTFAGVAGQNIRLDVLDPLNPDVRFALRGPGGSLFESVTADTVTVLPENGEYELIVGGTAPGSYRFQIDEVAPTQLVLGTPFAGTLAAGGHAQLFRLPIANTQALSIVLDAASSEGHNELYAKIGSPPTRSDYQFASFTPGAVDQQVVIPAAAPGDWFILVYGEAVPEPSSFTLLARGADVIVNSVTPNRLPTIVVGICDPVPVVELVIEGTGFHDVTAVEIVTDTGVVVSSPLRIEVESSQRLRATFAPDKRVEVPVDDLFDFFSFFGRDTTASVRVTNQDGSVGLLEKPFSFVGSASFFCQQESPSLRTNLTLPGLFRPVGVQSLTIEYENIGALPLPSPILVLRLNNDDPNLKPIMTLDASIVPVGFLTSANPDGFSDTIQLLASGRIPGVLQPGERMQVPVYLVGFSGDIPFHEPLQFVIEVVRQDVRRFEDNVFIDWLSLKDGLRPSTIDAEAWDAIFSNYMAAVGVAVASGGSVGTSSDYVAELSSNAVYFGRLGENVTDVGELFGFELAQADGLHPVQILASATDANVPAPGLDLGLGRTFPNTISSRYRNGPLGRGWFHSWETSLAVEPDGTVVVFTPGGGQRTFQPDRRPFRQASYFASPGDHGSLTRLADESFDLREADGLLTRYRADGQFQFVEDLNGNRITATYTGELLTRLEHSAGQLLDLAYNAAGLVESITDSDGRVVRYTYDAANEHLLTYEDFDGRITRYTYDDTTTIQKKHAITSVEAPTGVIRRYTYDDRGRLTSTFLNDGAERFDYSFGRAGDVTVTDATGAAGIVFLNRFGAIARVDDPLGNSTTVNFTDDFNPSRVIDATGQIYSFRFDTRGNVTSSSDPLGNTDRFNYGAFNRLRTFTDSKGNVTQYAYDARSNRISTADALGASVQRTYDPLGNPTSFTNRRGRVIATTFNDDGLLTRKTYEDGTSADYGYDGRGRLTSTVDEHGTTSFEYDSGDGLTRVSYPGGRFLEYTYDKAGRRTRMVDQDGFTVNYIYDAAGRLAGLTDAAGSNIVEYSYDAVGRLARRDNGNGTFTTYEYDDAGQLLHLLNHAPDSSVNSRFDYTYDSLGRRTVMATLDGTWTYEYDAIGQLTRAVLDSVNPAIPDQDLTYEYDAMGNRVRTIENGVVTDYSTNALNQYTQVGAATYQYDADGNLTSIIDGVATTNFTFDDEGRLIAVAMPGGVSSNEYNALNHRIATVDDGTRTEFLNDPTGIVDLVAEFNGSGAVVAYYTHGLGLSSRVDASGTVAFYDFDAIGSTVGLSDTAGSYANTYSYRPFGERLSTAETMQNPFEYIGQFGVSRDPIGLDYMRARYYTTVEGRFLSSDPIGILGGLNLYRYVYNDPASYVDPTGLAGEESAATLVLAAAQRFTSIAIWDAVAATLARTTIPGGVTQIVVESVVTEIVPRAPRGFVTPEVLRFNILLGLLAASWYLYSNPEFGEEAIANGGLGDLICDVTGCDNPNVPGFPGDSGSSEAVTSIDPNAKTAVAGFGPANFVDGDSVLAYRVDFENDATATAPAQRVDVSDQLSDKLDWDTFQFTEIAFGDQFIAIPPGSQFFHTIVDMNSTQNGTDFQVAIDLDFNSATGQIAAQFQSTDPATSLPPDALTGFLPPEDGTGRGQGHFSYLVRPIAGLASGTAIRNIAIIQFDFGEIIATNQIDPHDPLQGTDAAKEALVTIDAAGPTSGVNPLAAITNSTSFPVSWSGADDVSGSGIATFDIFVSDNGGPFMPFQSDTAAMTADFTGEFGHTYGFFSIATDGVGHSEPTPAGAQATTTLTAPGPLVTDARINANAARTAIANLVLTFDLALTETTAENPTSYVLQSAGRDKRLGTPDDVTLTIATAVYDDALRTVTLTPQSAKPLKLNQFLRITAKGTSGVTGASGAALDGDANNAPGGDFIRLLGLGTKLSFLDPTGDTVSFALKKGGLIELSLPATGDPTVRLSGNVAGTSSLTGTVKKPKAGTSDGRATIASIAGAAGVNTTGVVRCSPSVTTNCLEIGSIAAAVVDAILES